MNDQERQIITDIFHRLEGTAGQARDADAERFIADKLRTQPYAPYAMAQALYVQEEAMKSLNQQLEQLKAENAELQQRPASGGGGILSSIFGGGSRPQPASFSRPGQPQGGYAPQQGGPWGGAPQPAPQGGPWGGQQGGYGQGGYGQGGGFAQPQAAGGGGFLRGALTTAAGVAGGMVVGNALMNAFSGGHHQTLGSLSNADMSSMGFGGSDASALGGGDAGGFQNASFGDGGSAFDEGGGSSPDASFQDASYDDGGSDFGGGGSDDSSWS